MFTYLNFFATQFRPSNSQNEEIERLTTIGCADYIGKHWGSGKISTPSPYTCMSIMSPCQYQIGSRLYFLNGVYICALLLVNGMQKMPNMSSSIEITDLPLKHHDRWMWKHRHTKHNARLENRDFKSFGLTFYVLDAGLFLLMNL